MGISGSQWQLCQTRGGHMDKYGLLERNQGSSGCRKRFLPTYHPSLKRPGNMCCGERQGSSSLGRHGTLDGLCRPQTAAGEGQSMDASVGKVAHTLLWGWCWGNMGWDRAVRQAVGEGVSGRAADITVPGYGTWGQTVSSCTRVL